MFRSNSSRNPSFTKRVDKASSKKRTSFSSASKSRRIEHAASQMDGLMQSSPATTLSQQTSPTLTSAIITLSIGREQRLFAAHEDVLSHSPYLASLCRAHFFASPKRIELPDEEPEIFSALLEFLYKGDYYPRLEFDRRRQSWALEDAQDTAAAGKMPVELLVPTDEGMQGVLRDTVIYCTALRFQLPTLSRLALRKQGLQQGISCSLLLSSARYAYAATPEHDSALRAHYLALIIRSRRVFKRSGSLQAEMERGGKMWFDLFVAMVNWVDGEGR